MNHKTHIYGFIDPKTSEVKYISKVDKLQRWKHKIKVNEFS